MDEFRISYSITRRQDGERDFTEIGFGAAGGVRTVDDALQFVESAIRSRQWETTAEMPDPRKF